jgi:hypothetical protein
MRIGLDAYTTNDLPLSRTWLVLKEEIMLEELGSLGGWQGTTHKDG